MLTIQTTNNQVLISKDNGPVQSYAKNELNYSFDKTMLFLGTSSGRNLYSEAFSNGIMLNDQEVTFENVIAKLEMIFNSAGNIKPGEALVIVNDFIESKQKIADAIKSKGVDASANDSAMLLSQKIRKIEPAQPVFLSSGNLNPRWTDLQSKIAAHYSEDRKYAWAFGFLGENKTFTLSGGDYYICSDGFESEVSVEHTFSSNLDEDKQDNWVIIYTQHPTYVFPEELISYVIGAAFYNTLPSNVKFYGSNIAFISVNADNNAGTTMSLPESYARNTGISYFLIPEGIENMNIGEYAFSGCKVLTDLTISKTLKKITIGNCAFQNCNSLFLFDTTASKQNLEDIVIGNYSFQNTTFKKNVSISCINSIEINGYSFTNAKMDEITLEAKNIRFINLYGFRDSFVRKINLNASETLTTSSTIFYSPFIEEIFIKSPKIALIMPNVTFNNILATKITLEDGWNWSLALNTVPNQSIESMAQNAEAFADRTGQSPLTYTIGATKLAALSADRPDIIELLQSKNINVN